MYHDPDKVNYAAIRAKVEAEFRCKHEQTEVRNKVTSDGAPSIRRQCLRCGSKIGPVTPKRSLTPSQLDAIPAWDAQAEKQFHAAIEKAVDSMARCEQEKLDVAWQCRYDNYMESDGWKRRRELVFARSGGLCEGCREVKATDVHHFTYDDLGDEFLFQLVALCRLCHDRWHIKHPPQSADEPDGPD